MNEHQLGFKVGDRVHIVYGREVGQSGVLVLILPGKRGGNGDDRGRYVVEFGGGRRTYCSPDDLVLERVEPAG